MTTTKRQTALRFSATAQTLLQALTEDTGLSQSGVMELAIRDLARSRGIGPLPPQLSALTETDSSKILLPPQDFEPSEIPDDTAITSFRRPHSFLSNMNAAPVTFDDVEYPTVEHAYQAAKTLDAEWRAKILATGRPDWAKRMSKSKAFPVRPDWEMVKVGVMRGLLRQKFADPKRAQKLLATGQRRLIEGNTWDDRCWGMCKDADGHWVGENRLGELLMEIRSELSQGDGEHRR